MVRDDQVLVQLGKDDQVNQDYSLVDYFNDSCCEDKCAHRERSREPHDNCHLTIAVSLPC
jgi:hypothetical protein